MRKIWNAWTEDDGSLIFCAGDDPFRYFWVLPWTQELEWSTAKVARFHEPGQLLEWARGSGDIGVDVLNDPWVCKRNDSIDKFTSDIPVGIRKIVKSYSCCQFLMLRLAASLPSANDLLESNAVLLWLLAYWQHEYRHSKKQLEILLRLKQPALLSRLLGVTCGKQAVCFLRKLEVEEADTSLVVLLRTLFSDPSRLDLFRHHWTNINQRALEAVMRYNSPGLSRCLATEVSGVDKGGCIDQITQICSLWDELERQARDFGYTYDERRALGRLGSLKDMGELHRRWIKRTNAKGDNEVAEQARNMPPFPDPPFAGNDTIRPLGTPLELFIEGKEQSHCVYSRHDLGWGGQYAYYAIYHPERGTLEIRRQGNRWVLSEFKLRHNQRPSNKTISIVNEWLAREQSRVYKPWRCKNTRSRT